MKPKGIIRDAAGEVDLSRVATLIVDDNDFILKLIARVLRVFGAETIGSVKDAETAFDALRLQNYDLVICDYLMTPMNGLDFTRKIRRGESNAAPEIPIIMLTAHTELENVFQMRDAGVDELLAKPVSASAMLNRIVWAFESRRPFVKSETYVGPCRRRKSIPYDGEDRRGRSQTESATAASGAH